jgi:hypothetical protein
LVGAAQLTNPSVIRLVNGTLYIALSLPVFTGIHDEYPSKILVPQPPANRQKNPDDLFNRSPASYYHPL